MKAVCMLLGNITLDGYVILSEAKNLIVEIENKEILHSAEFILSEAEGLRSE